MKPFETLRLNPRLLSLPHRYVALWSFVVYFPMCHMVWGGPGALMADLGVLDFAGGIVVHITAGMGALVGAIMLGPRKENSMACGNIVLTFIGTGAGG